MSGQKIGSESLVKILTEEFWRHAAHESGKFLF